MTRKERQEARAERFCKYADNAEERAAKTARNISKGTVVDVPAHNIPSFKPCPEFKEYCTLRIRQMKVIVTGGEGFIGKALAIALSKRGVEVVSVDRVNGREAGEYPHINGERKQKPNRFIKLLKYEKNKTNQTCQSR